MLLINTLKTQRVICLLVRHDESYVFTINHNIYLPGEFNLRNIFNEFRLSDEVPFVKYKDRLTKEIIYKVYKPNTAKRSYNYLPIISKETLSNWIRYKGVEFNDGELKALRIFPKDISYKVFIYKQKPNLCLLEQFIK